VLVVDGGSTDRTTELVTAGDGVRLITSPPGRARQMSAGAALATGNVLMFLHADCRPPAGAARAVLRALNTCPGAPGGAFRMVIDAPARVFRVLERLAYLRCRLTGICCGDQGLFVRRPEPKAAAAAVRTVTHPGRDGRLARRRRRSQRARMARRNAFTAAVWSSRRTNRSRSAGSRPGRNRLRACSV
jgi:glycosyltransferase involved in cell wall biosynthesis